MTTHDRTRTLRSLTATIAAAAVLAGTLGAANPQPTLAASCSIWEEGSTTVYPAIDAARPTWQSLALNAGCTLTLNATGSSNGLDGLRTFREPLQQFTASSRPFNKSSERDNLYAWKIGGDAMVIQVASASEMAFISQISGAQVQGIFNGTITRWNQGGLGGPDVAIFRDCRIVGSGSRDDFLRLFGITAAQETCDSRLTTSADEANAAKTPYHIVYTSLANDGIPGTKALRLSGGVGALGGNATTFVAPSVQTVQNNTYPAPRELFLAVNKFNKMPTGKSHTDSTEYVKAYEFINYMASSAGQAFVAQVGFVPVSPFVPFPASDVNLDGVVSLPDLGQVTGKWGRTDTPKGWVRADANKDGTIALADIGTVTGKWGLTGAGNAFVAPN